MQRYNPIKYKWEKNPDGKYAYGATCVKDCPKHLLKVIHLITPRISISKFLSRKTFKYNANLPPSQDSGACVRACPPKKKNEDGKCVPCDGPCPKVCNFNDKQIHAGNIDRLQNCTVIEGHITILDSSFDGYQASMNMQAIAMYI